MNRIPLVVAIRGWTTTGEPLLFGQKGGDLPKSFLEALRGSFTDAEVLCPELEMGMFSMRTPESLAQDVFDAIDQRFARGDVGRIVLLGYSTGSLLARRVFCMAHGARPDGTLGGRVVAWAHCIDRLVVLSGITRGWELSSAAPANVRFLAPLLLFMSWVVGHVKQLARRHRTSPDRFATKPFVYQVERGSPFVVSARIQYVAVMRALAAAPDTGMHRPEPERSLRHEGLPSTVFLLGSKDFFISPADCMELGPRAEFVFVELPGTTHTDAVQVADGSHNAPTRLERLLASINLPLPDLRRQPWAVRANDIDDYLDPMDITEPAGARDPEQVEHVVMIVHGIRDNGFWTKRVAREVKSLARVLGTSVRSPTPTYGYFSMWDFVRPGGRARATYWFMERYADVKSHFPAARVSFVGHSNGTYIATRALKICSAIEFENVVFAGSVVRRDYDWTDLRGRVKRVVNYVGCADRVVAFIPAAFETLRLRWLDVGGAGAFGFRQKQGAKGGVSVHEVRFVKGGHGAAIEETFWPEIARFVLTGETPSRSAEPRPNHLVWLFRAAPAFTAGGILVALAVLLLPIALPLVLGSAVEFDLVLWFAVATGGLVVSILAVRFLKQW